MTTTVTIDDDLFAAAARALKASDPAEVVQQALRAAIERGAELPIESYTPERIAEFQAAEADLERFLQQKGLRPSGA